MKYSSPSQRRKSSKEYDSRSSSSSSRSAATKSRFKSKKKRSLSCSGTGTEEETSKRTGQTHGAFPVKANENNLNSKRRRRIPDTSSSSSVRSDRNSSRRRNHTTASPSDSSRSSMDSGRGAEKKVSSSRSAMRKGIPSATTKRQHNPVRSTAEVEVVGKKRRKDNLKTTSSPASRNILSANATGAENKTCLLVQKEPCIDDGSANDEAGPTSLVAEQDPGSTEVTAGLQARGNRARKIRLAAVRNQAITTLVQVGRKGFLSHGSTPSPLNGATSQVPRQDTSANPGPGQENGEHEPPKTQPPEDVPPANGPASRAPTDEVNINEMLEIALDTLLLVSTLIVLYIELQDAEPDQQQDNANGGS
ncbi:hypothetical protein V5799_004018 [Amblyomma americanum]|uniref:Uncharacterized protein n=1 Tax=Amblyomma americanum TaxID=6943 RepID=A0AAQ4D7B4_AMBAM